MVLASTQHTQEMRRNIYWVIKAAGASFMPTVLKSGSLNLLEPTGSVEGLLYLW